MNERVCANCRAVVSGSPQHPCDKCGSLDGLDLALEFAKDEAALDAIRKAAEKAEVRFKLHPPQPTDMFFEIWELAHIAYAQTHPDKPEALCDAHAEQMKEGKDAQAEKR